MLFKPIPSVNLESDGGTVVNKRGTQKGWRELNFRFEIICKVGE